MSDKKISQLQQATTPLTGTELVPIVQGGINKKVLISDISYTGAVGPTGAQGPQGPQGVQGELGPIGPTGANGLQGLQGAQGPTGSTGSQGNIGPTGATGLDGAVGPTGAQGPQGPQGVQGNGFKISKIYSSVSDLLSDTNPTGINQGEFAIISTVDPNDPDNGKLYIWTGVSYEFINDLSGPQGIQGPQGPQGVQGELGPIGPTGATGAVGPTGSTPSIPNAQFAHCLHVSQTGSDSTGDGSLNKPFATITYALSQLPGGRDSNNRYCILLGAGQYNETSLSLPAWVSIVGQGYWSTRVNVSSNQVTLNTSSGEFDSNSRVGIFNLQLAGSTGINIDLSLRPNASCVLDLVGLWVNGDVNWNVRGYGADYLQVYRCFFFGNLNITNGQGELDDTVIAGNTTVTCSNMNPTDVQAFDFSYTRIGGSLNYISDDTRPQKSRLTACQFSNLVATGNGIIVSSDSISLPLLASDISLSGGATLSKLTSAYSEVYNNSSSGLTSVNVQSAIDEVYSKRNIVPSGSIRPLTPVIGQSFFDTSLTPSRTIWFNGSTWVDAFGMSV